MPLTNAERQARYRAHHAGDHQLCPAGRPCRKPAADAPPAPAPAPRRAGPTPPLDVVPAHTAPASPPAAAEDEWAAELPAAGRPRERQPWDEVTPRELWEELQPQLGVAHRAVLAEACRLKSRLDRLDAIVEGNDEWLRISEQHGDVVVTVDAGLAEARQHAIALRALLTDLVKALPKGTGRPAPPKGGGLADLSARIAARRAQAAR
jgi:hypothetical protein